MTERTEDPAERWYTEKTCNGVWVYRDCGLNEFWSYDGLHFTGDHVPEEAAYSSLISITKFTADAIRAGWKKEEGQ